MNSIDDVKAAYEKFKTDMFAKVAALQATVDAQGGVSPDIQAKIDALVAEETADDAALQPPAA